MNTKPSKRILEHVARPVTRSKLFWWLFHNHDLLTERLGGERMSWISLCPLFAEEGLCDARGKPPSVRTARETWRQVRKAVAAARAREVARLVARPAEAPLPGPAAVPGLTGAASWPVPSRDAAASATRDPGSAVRIQGFDLSDPRLTEEDRRRLKEAQDGLLGQFAKLDARFRLG